VTQALSQYDIATSIALPQLAAFTALAVLAGIGAALVPARRASRLNVLGGLHYE
jgi:putative ABC transport system permease protein